MRRGGEGVGGRKVRGEKVSDSGYSLATFPSVPHTLCSPEET